MVQLKCEKVNNVFKCKQWLPLETANTCFMIKT